VVDTLEENPEETLHVPHRDTLFLGRILYSDAEAMAIFPIPWNFLSVAGL
jgi:hypothetical protein